MPILCEVRVAAGIAADSRAPDRFLSPIVGLRGETWNGSEDAVLAWVQLEQGDKIPLIARDYEAIWCNFDVGATLETIRGETYPGAELARPIVSRLPFDYSRLPTWFVGWAARVLDRPVDLGRAPDYPAYPLDHSADLLFALSRGDPDARPLSWPEGRRYAVVLTHDVDSSWIFENPRWLEAFAAAEAACGMRSAWFVVPTAIAGESSRRGLEWLRNAGHEIGVHGYRHDPALAGRPFDELVETFARGRALVGAFHEGEPGYRAPWLSRSETMRRALAAAGYLYDSSSPAANIQRNNPRSNNGCGTLFPFMQDGLVILPVTLPQDLMTAPLAMEPQDYWDWIETLIGGISQWGGLVVVSTHIQPHHSANEPMLQGYTRLLGRLSADVEAWFTLPREVAQWARSRLG